MVQPPTRDAAANISNVAENRIQQVSGRISYALLPGRRPFRDTAARAHTHKAHLGRRALVSEAEVHVVQQVQ